MKSILSNRPIRSGPQPRGSSPARFVRGLVFGLFLGALACSSPSTPPRSSAEGVSGLVITGVTVISAERTEPLTDAWVAVEKGRIVAVGSGPLPERLGGFERFEARGRYLIPGLIDSHVHLSSIPGMLYPQQQSNPALVEGYFRQMPRSYLFHGFTTLIDLGTGDPELLGELRELPKAPDVFGCGQSMPLANSYPMVLAPETVRFEIFPNFLYDPLRAEQIPGRFAPSDHSPAAAADRVRQAGGICVKTYVEDGFGLAKVWPVPSASMLQEVRAEAHSAGVPLAVHANSHDAYVRALDGGADVLAHGLWTWDAYQGEDDGSTLPPAIEALLDRVVEEGAASMPTLRVIAGDRALFDSEFLQDPALRQVLPEELLAWYGTEEGQRFGQQLLEGFPPHQQTPETAYEGHTAALSRVRRGTAYLSRRGATLLFGSDTPSGPSYGNPPGYNGYLELKAWAAADVPLDRLFSATTLENAKAFHLDDRYGTLEPGKVANLLILRDNPLENVEAYDSIETVILHGRPIDRSSLTAGRVDP